MARKPRAEEPPFTEGDDVWVQCKVTRLAEGDGAPMQVTVRMPNGNLETFPYGEDYVRTRADD